MDATSPTVRSRISPHTQVGFVGLRRSSDPSFHAVIDLTTGRAVGVASYLRIDPPAGSIEVGHIAYSPLLQKTPAATEAMYLMMRQAFELGYRRYEWKCDALNAGSRAAAQRLGFSSEGVFRQARVNKGRNRDTAWFAAIDSEWPALDRAFRQWLDPANFDAARATTDQPRVADAASARQARSGVARLKPRAPSVRAIQKEREGFSRAQLEREASAERNCNRMSRRVANAHTRVQKSAPHSPSVENAVSCRAVGRRDRSWTFCSSNTFSPSSKSGRSHAPRERVGRTQPAISQSIKKLEEEVGAPLFARDVHDVSLTEAGRVLRRIRTQNGARPGRCDAGGGRAEDAARPGTLNIAAHESAAVYLLPAPLRTYLARYPDVKVGIFRSRLAEIPRQVLDREDQSRVREGRAGVSRAEMDRRAR